MQLRIFIYIQEFKDFINAFALIGVADRTTVIPIGFIVSKKKIYISLSNGNLVSVDLLTGKSLDVVKIDGEKISRPYIFNNEMFVIRDNAILKLN